VIAAPRMSWWPPPRQKNVGVAPITTNASGGRTHMVMGWRAGGSGERGGLGVMVNQAGRVQARRGGQAAVAGVAVLVVVVVVFPGAVAAHVPGWV
jgi:hypothetical protein